MGIRSRTTTTESSSTGTAEVMRQHRRFSGLYLAPLPGLLFAWMLHVWTTGVHWGPIDTPGSEGVTALLGTSLGAVSVVLAFTAWHFSAHRDAPVRWAFTVSTLTISLLFAANVWRGPSYWVSGAFLVLGFTVATVWSLSRTNVARNDKRSDGESQQVERKGFLETVGASALTKWKSWIERDEKGEPARLVVQAKHGEGQTAAVMAENVDAIASMVASETGLPVPHGMHTAVPGERADESTTTIMLGNPFKGHRPLGPLTNPGKSIAEWTSFADYADGQPFFMTIAAGLNIPGSCSYCIAGITRAGKTVAENQMLTDWLSRIDFVLLYLNQAKGMQDIRPLLPAVEAAVIAEDGDAGHGDYVAGAESLKKIMSYRQSQLAKFGVSAWSPRCGDPDPARRPSIVDPASPIGARIVMEQMPFLLAHFAEADSILSSGKMSAHGVFIASKGLSLGVASGWSLQSPSYKIMDTDLRRNLGMRLCFGVADDDAAEFMLDTEERQAGARPEKWGQKKPGQFYASGPGIEQNRVPTALKTRFLVGEEKHADGKDKTFDELNDEYVAELLRRNYENAKTVCKLDRGSAEATQGWWDEQVEKTNDLRDRMLHGKVADDPAPRTPHSAPADSAATPQPSRTPHPAPRTFTPQGMDSADPAPKPRPRPQPDPHDDDAISAEEIEEGAEEFMDDVRSTHGGTPLDDPDMEEVRSELYPADDEDTEELRNTSIHPPANVPTEDFDPLADSAEDDKPTAKTRQEAIEVLAGALDALIAERGNGRSVVTGPGEIAERHGLRSRPWVTDEVNKLLMGQGDLASRYVAELDGKPKLGRYKIRRIGQTDHQE